MILYSFFRSSAAYRVRIALNLKNLPYETVGVDLLKNGGEHLSDRYKAVNPQMRVPALGLPDGDVLLQSLAIIDYLDERFPEPPLLPADPLAKARVRAVAQIIAADIHPLNNTGALRYLKHRLGHVQDELDTWSKHWIGAGFEAIERLIDPAPYTFGASPTLADICLVPQVANARRIAMPLDRFPKICAVEAACLALPAFDRARPEVQPDTPATGVPVGV
ncbi:maleylacetoacetate isomerase [Rhodoplanes sp. SY1]|uniref:maleylacetoacetate isomerase n=1 Tax=Rhodoplanes sp. SY1 TaxID=3166646 RepID=UPI0038B5D969